MAGRCRCGRFSATFHFRRRQPALPTAEMAASSARSPATVPAGAGRADMADGDSDEGRDVFLSSVCLRLPVVISERFAVVYARERTSNGGSIWSDALSANVGKCLFEANKVVLKLTPNLFPKKNGYSRLCVSPGPFSLVNLWFCRKWWIWFGFALVGGVMAPSSLLTGGSLSAFCCFSSRLTRPLRAEGFLSRSPQTYSARRPAGALPGPTGSTPMTTTSLLVRTRLHPTLCPTVLGDGSVGCP